MIILLKGVRDAYRMVKRVLKKTRKLCEMIHETIKDSENPLVFALTTKAIENVKGRLGRNDTNKICCTFDSYYWNGKVEISIAFVINHIY